MTGTIFDILNEDLPKGQKGFMEAAQRAPDPKDDSFFNTLKDYGKTILKGSVEGLSKLGTVMGPLQGPEETRQQLERQTEFLNEEFPTDEGYVQKSIRKGLKETPTMLSFPGSASLDTATRTLLSGFAGEGAKELGLPEWAQAAAELTAFIGPDILKPLLASGSNKKIIEFAKKAGMSDKEITPLLQSDFKQKWLAKLSPRRGSTQEALESTKKSVQNVYSSIQESPLAAKEISEKANGQFINEVRNLLDSMPSQVRSKIERDLSDLLENKITGKSLINFYSDVNHYLGDNAKQLSLLKEPIKKALQSVSPEVAKDFDMVNKLYSKYYTIAQRLKPNLQSDLIGAAKPIGLLVGLVTGYYPQILLFGGKTLAGKVAQQMLINPKLQQISTKMASAIEKNNLPIVKKLIDALSFNIKKVSPEMSEELNSISDEEIFQLFKNQKQKD